jgi:hypothetical protein
LRAGLLSRTTAGKSSAPFLSITCTHAHMHTCTHKRRAFNHMQPSFQLHARIHALAQTDDRHARATFGALTHMYGTVCFPLTRYASVR